MEQKAPRKHKIIGQNRKCFEGSWSSGNINHLSRRRSKKQKALVHSQYRMQALLVKNGRTNVHSKRSRVLLGAWKSQQKVQLRTTHKWVSPDDFLSYDITALPTSFHAAKNEFAETRYTRSRARTLRFVLWTRTVKSLPFFTVGIRVGFLENRERE